jgi:hypothetical protein
MKRDVWSHQHTLAEGHTPSAAHKCPIANCGIIANLKSAAQVPQYSGAFDHGELTDRDTSADYDASFA